MGVLGDLVSHMVVSFCQVRCVGMCLCVFVSMLFVFLYASATLSVFVCLYLCISVCVRRAVPRQACFRGDEVKAERRGIM